MKKPTLKGPPPQVFSLLSEEDRSTARSLERRGHWLAGWEPEKGLHHREGEPAEVKPKLDEFGFAVRTFALSRDLNIL